MPLPDSTINALTNGIDGVEVHPEGTVTFDGPDAVNLFRLVVIRRALDLELRTGMRASRHSALAAANQALGTNYRTKQKALDHIAGLLDVTRD
jgi:hypothetical protein